MFPTICTLIQKLLSLFFPDWSGLPPLHLNVGLYRGSVTLHEIVNILDGLTICIVLTFG